MKVLDTKKGKITARRILDIDRLDEVAFVMCEAFKLSDTECQRKMAECRFLFEYASNYFYYGAETETGKIVSVAQLSLPCGNDIYGPKYVNVSDIATLADYRNNGISNFLFAEFTSDICRLYPKIKTMRLKAENRELAKHYKNIGFRYAQLPINDTAIAMRKRIGKTR